ncbi:MAG: hypothetical protein QG673_1713 [Pseudomonadota bacterium]|nr:hypothetical protein [Pseudomonadota bacterium]
MIPVSQRSFTNSNNVSLTNQVSNIHHSSNLITNLGMNHSIETQLDGLTQKLKISTNKIEVLEAISAIEIKREETTDKVKVQLWLIVDYALQFYSGCSPDLLFEIQNKIIDSDAEYDIGHIFDLQNAICGEEHRGFYLNKDFVMSGVSSPLANHLKQIKIGLIHFGRYELLHKNFSNLPSVRDYVYCCIAIPYRNLIMDAFAIYSKIKKPIQLENCESLLLNLVKVAHYSPINSDHKLEVAHMLLISLKNGVIEVKNNDEGLRMLKIINGLVKNNDFNKVNDITNIRDYNEMISELCQKLSSRSYGFCEKLTGVNWLTVDYYDFSKLKGIELEDTPPSITTISNALSSKIASVRPSYNKYEQFSNVMKRRFSDLLKQSDTLKSALDILKKEIFKFAGIEPGKNKFTRSDDLFVDYIIEKVSFKGFPYVKIYLMLTLRLYRLLQSKSMIIHSDLNLNSNEIIEDIEKQKLYDKIKVSYSPVFNEPNVLILIFPKNTLIMNEIEEVKCEIKRFDN